jgi:hypothetical protein
MRGNLLFGGVVLSAFLIVIGVWSLSCYVVLGRWKAALTELFQGIIDSFALPPLSPTQLLILRAPGDEASAALGASAFATLAFTKLSRSADVVYRFGTWLQKVNSSLGWRSRLAVTFLALSSALAAMIGFPEHANAYVALPLLLVVALSILIGWGFLLKQLGNYGEIIRVLYICLLAPFLVFCSIFSTPFGEDAALAATLAEISAETTPIGRFWVLNLRASTAEGWWHCLSYNDPEAFEAIVAWINGTLV